MKPPYKWVRKSVTMSDLKSTRCAHCRVSFQTIDGRVGSLCLACFLESRRQLDWIKDRDREPAELR